MAGDAGDGRVDTNFTPEESQELMSSNFGELVHRITITTMVGQMNHVEFRGRNTWKYMEIHNPWNNINIQA